MCLAADGESRQLLGVASPSTMESRQGLNSDRHALSIETSHQLISAGPKLDLVRGARKGMN